MISLIISGVAGVIILLPVLWGLIRGKRQSAFRLVWVILTAVLSFLIAMFVAKILIDVVKIQGKTIPQYALDYLAKSNEMIAPDVEGLNIPDLNVSE